MSSWQNDSAPRLMLAQSWTNCVIEHLFILANVGCSTIWPSALLLFLSQFLFIFPSLFYTKSCRNWRALLPINDNPHFFTIMNKEQFYSAGNYSRAFWTVCSTCQKLTTHTHSHTHTHTHTHTHSRRQCQQCRRQGRRRSVSAVGFSVSRIQSFCVSTHALFSTIMNVLRNKTYLVIVTKLWKEAGTIQSPICQERLFFYEKFQQKVIKWIAGKGNKSTSKERPILSTFLI